MFNIKLIILVALTIAMVQSCSIEEPEEVQCGCGKPQCASCGSRSCGSRSCGCGCNPCRCASSCGCGCKD
ncbi:keratin-associated protein 5-9 [Drosophila teissieri]|uniref:keratin-associated protein 5-9 n=1 Tax=Drosophila teissieri TaxID=7243 RepID=UPI001CBA2FC5|nr:keratin-associated protein 5-9 [Drosophila teissieri]